MVQTGWAVSLPKNASQQSVHLTLGILRQSQAFFYALAFFWLDGFAVPAPAQVTQTVSPLPEKLSLERIQYNEDSDVWRRRYQYSLCLGVF